MQRLSCKVVSRLAVLNRIFGGVVCCSFYVRDRTIGLFDEATIEMMNRR